MGGAILVNTGYPPSKELAEISLSEPALLNKLSYLNLTENVSGPSAET